MFESKELQELRMKVVLMEEREKLWEEKLALADKMAEAKWEKECYHYAHTLASEYGEKFAKMADTVLDGYPEFPTINIPNCK